jgi:hypothetical protein
MSYLNRRRWQRRRTLREFIVWVQESGWVTEDWVKSEEIYILGYMMV